MERETAFHRKRKEEENEMKRRKEMEACLGALGLRLMHQVPSLFARQIGVGSLDLLRIDLVDEVEGLHIDAVCRQCRLP